MVERWVRNVNFKAFMVDSAQMNWNVVREIYGTCDKMVLMQGNDRSCSFH